MIDLAQILAHYGIQGEVIGSQTGPLITQIKFKPAAGTKVKIIETILEDIAREAGYKSLRISNFCQDNCIGFEVPNENLQTVYLKDVLSTDELKTTKCALPINLGVKIDGTPFFTDLAKMPHLLVAGATGSGKSVGLNAFILSLINAKRSHELKFVLIDPKRIEFSVYNNQEYMYMPVITDNSKASLALEHLTEEMNRRYTLFEKSKTKNIEEYNQKEGYIPYIVTIVDEFSDLVLSDKAVEKQIQILAQKARAAGIHLILATQRPSVDVVTGSIKANFPSRLAFKTASGVDSKTILNTTGAENLIGRGDCLFLASDGELIRIHGAYITTEEIEVILKPYHTEIKDILQDKTTPKNEINKDKSKKKKQFFPSCCQGCLLLKWLC
jgi:S-DNA-T family DNA segregation ATPase FtsK/SpoIIIE